MASWTFSHRKGSPKEHECAAVAVGHELYYFGENGGGEESGGGEDQIGVQVFNTVSLRWKRLTPARVGGGRLAHVPSSRDGHTAVLIGGTVYVWGGFINGAAREHCNVLHAFDAAAHTWSKPQVSGAVPEARYRHSACVLGKVMFVHGGYGRLTGYTNDTCKVDTDVMVWTLINDGGTPRRTSSSHSATIIGTKMFVFGGVQGVGPFQNHCKHETTRVFDTETELWLQTPSAQHRIPRRSLLAPSAQLLPDGCSYHLAFAYNGELYIFGGWCKGSCSNDLWKLSPETFSWRKLEPKGTPPCPTYRTCCCVVGDRVFLFGGANTANDLFVLDLSPRLKMLCKLAVIQYGLDRSKLPHNVRWELAAMGASTKRKRNNNKANVTTQQVPKTPKKRRV